MVRKETNLKKIAFTKIAVSSLIATLASSGFAFAQSSVSNVFVDEVVVTAQKREQNLQDVGIAVTAISGDQMRALGFTNAQEITAMAPGVSTIQPNGEANYAIGIRGVANNDFTTNVESPIAVYVDEVYISQMSGAGFMLFDMERAEILRGPQGTLFGRNATGGLVQYVTVKPSQESGGYGNITYGEYNQLKLEGGIGFALSDRLSMRISAISNQRDGYVANRLNPTQDLNNANDFAGRIQLLWEGENWDALLNLRQGRQDIRTGFFQHKTTLEANGRLSSPDTVNPYLNNAQGEVGYIDDDGDVYAGDYDLTGHNDLETKGYSFTLNGQGDNLKFTSITDFSTTERDYIEDSDASPTDYFNFFLTTDAEQFSQEFRLSGQSDSARWLAGVYYLDLQVSDSNGGIAHGFLCDYFELLGDGVSAECRDRDHGDTRLGLFNPYETETESWSLFGQYEQDLSNSLTLIVGARAIEEEKTHTYQDILASYDALAVSGRDSRTSHDTVLLAYDGARDDSEWAGRVQLDWRPTEDALYYVSWNRGVKSGGFNAPLLPTIPEDDAQRAGFEDFMEYVPEQLDAFEIGFKKEFENNLTVNGAVFYYDYKDYQAFSIIGLDTFTRNAEAESYGAEIEIQSSPMPGLDMLFGLGYVDTEVTDVPGINSTSNPDAYGVILGQTTGGSQNGGAVSPVQTPEWNLNALVRYETAMPSLKGNVAFQLAVEHRDEHYFNLTNTDSLRENGYILFNGSISYYPSASDNVTLRLGVKNLTNEEYVVQGFDLGGTITNASGFWGMTEHYYGQPRMWSVSANYLF